MADDLVRVRALRTRLPAVDLRVLEAGIPVAVFLVAERLLAVRLAIALAFLAALAVFARNRGRGTIRFLNLLGFAVVAVSAAAGLLSGSGKAFAAQNLVSDVLVAGVGLGSIAWRRPLVGLVARELLPGLRATMPVDHPAFVLLTYVNAALNLVTAGMRAYLLEELDVTTYVLVSRAAGLPLTAAFYGLCVWAIVRAVGWGPLMGVWPPRASPLPPHGSRRSVLELDPEGGELVADSIRESELARRPQLGPHPDEEIDEGSGVLGPPGRRGLEGETENP